jgi:hypothetical protein
MEGGIKGEERKRETHKRGERGKRTEGWRGRGERKRESERELEIDR